MSNVNHTELEAALDKYIETFFEKVNVDNAQFAISEFDEQWKVIEVDTYEFDSKYGKSLAILSISFFISPSTTVKDVTFLSKLIEEYDNSLPYPKSLIYSYEDLYYVVGICWHKMGKNRKAIASFKKSIYHRISISNYGDRTIAYRFRKCDKFLYKSLINELLTLTSPTAFNDPFDTPYLSLLESDSSDISQLVYQAYKEGLKVACFTSNSKLPYKSNINYAVVRNEKKQDYCNEEFLNSLLWAHYADSHKGICIKYNFDNSVTKTDLFDSGIVAFFYDIIYYDRDVKNLKSDDGPFLFDKAFFYKGKQWEYENELRFLYYDVNGKGKHATIAIPDSIEAIYFGLKCSQKDKNAIRKIMKGKNVQFYQIIEDEKRFGHLQAVKI